MASGEQTTLDAAKRRMRVRILIVAAILILASIAVVGWVLKGDHLSFEAYTDKDRYLPGETINVTVKFTNHGFGRVTLSFATSGKSGYGVYSENGSLVGGIPITVTMAFTHASMGPGESVIYVLHWDQAVGPDHTRVPYPGAYYILARSASLEYHATAATAVFTITADLAS